MEKVFKILKYFRFVFFIFLGVLIILTFIFLFSFIFEPTSKPLNIILSNQSSHQATISWITKKPTRSTVFVTSSKNLPFLPFFIKLEKDDGEKNLVKRGFYETHHVTTGSLLENTKYQFVIFQGLRKVSQGTFTTGPNASSINTPNPVYGKVLNADKKSPSVGSIVYIRVIDKKNRSSLLSTLTNVEGRWSIDLGNLRTKDLKNIFPISKDSIETAIIEAGSKGRFSIESKPGKDKPWIDVILSSK